mmetsp:Transcript_16782/g.39939  ORF Transcript_16782/g.39939 Transcript_16782/m.39939 type:complete len:357 (-) Transcript_16782:183-1253(-)
MPLIGNFRGYVYCAGDVRVTETDTEVVEPPPAPNLPTLPPASLPLSSPPPLPPSPSPSPPPPPSPPPSSPPPPRPPSPPPSSPPPPPPPSPPPSSPPPPSPPSPPPSPPTPPSPPSPPPSPPPPPPPPSPPPSAPQPPPPLPPPTPLTRPAYLITLTLSIGGLNPEDSNAGQQLVQIIAKVFEVERGDVTITMGPTEYRSLEAEVMIEKNDQTEARFSNFDRVQAQKMFDDNNYGDIVVEEAESKLLGPEKANGGNRGGLSQSTIISIAAGCAGGLLFLVIVISIFVCLWIRRKGKVADVAGGNEGSSDEEDDEDEEGNLRSQSSTPAKTGTPVRYDEVLSFHSDSSGGGSSKAGS